MNLDEVDRPMVVEDAFGRGFQFMPETVIHREKDGVPYDHVMEGGWWDLSMAVKLDPDQIALPFKVVWG